jgi:hypothetical protein
MTIEIPLSKNGKNKGLHVTIVDECDSDLSQLNWHIKTNTDYQLYAIRKPSLENNFRWMHRCILERVLGRALTKDELVDHINSDTLDNRRENLRVATQSQNQSNRGKQSNNTSGFKGVCWSSSSKKWLAAIRVNGKRYHLGLANTPEEAHELYKKACLEFFGEFSRFE